MKKKLSLLLAIVMMAMLAFGLTGCGTAKEDKTANEPKLDKDTVIKEAVDNYYATMPMDGEFKFNKIAYKKVKELVDKNDATYQIIDIRAAADYKKGHIKGAINIPFDKDFTKSLDKLDKGKSNIIVCYTGQTAGQTNSLLRVLGYKSLAMDKGMGGWTTQPDSGPANGYDVVTE